MKWLRTVGLLTIVLMPAAARADWRDWIFAPRHDGYQAQNRWDNHEHYRRPGYGYQNYRPQPRPDYAIENGIRSGRLSYREVRELREEQRDIHREASRYWSDGRLTPYERHELREEWDDYRDKLDHELRDGERRR